MNNYSTRHTISNNTQDTKKSSNKPTQLFNRRFILYNLEITPRKITVIGKEYNIKTTHITTKEKYNIHTSYSNIFDNSNNFNTPEREAPQKYSHIRYEFNN